MRIPLKSSALLIVLCSLLAGCGGKQPEETPRSEGAKPAASQTAESQNAPAPTKPTAASNEPAKSTAAAPAKSESAKTEAAKPAAATPTKAEAASAEPVQAVAAKSAPAPVVQEKRPTPKDVAILKGAPMGGVKFEHKLHVERAGNKCVTCHHASRPEKPGMAAQESCLSCHTKPSAPGMKTGLPAAFHNAAAQTGTCIDCHKAENAKGKKAPAKCLDCHRRENT